MAENSKRVENECLQALSSFSIELDQLVAFKYVVRTPKCYLYDDATRIQIQEYHGIDLKTYALQNFPSPTPESLRQQCHQLGKSLGLYIKAFYRKTEKQTESKLYAELKSNKEMQALKHMINYDWLLQRIDMFPDILERARDMFMKVKEQAVDELKSPENLACIHGDFWTGKYDDLTIGLWEHY